MRIKGVDFDDHLLAAQREGSLVVFAGAGVSMGPPSNYPSFKELAEEIGKLARDKIKSDEPIEYYFGRLVRRDFPVHERVKHLLSDSASKPKGLHEDLLRLFSDINRVRLVTTNFDTHLQTAAEDVYGKAPEVFKGPALPLGHDFHGLVYLHGSVLDDSRQLILTDQDFGRAYLTEGWATRFLFSMFSRYTVLFVGYSHNDTIMHYLSRGLPPERTGTRFALVDASANMDEWRYRGIDPLSYSLLMDGIDHSNLDVSVAGWADLANRGALDTEQRIAELVEGEPPLDPESQGYLLWATKDRIALRFFVRHAKEPEWLKWVADHKLLDSLFSPKDLSEREWELAVWVAEDFAADHPESVFCILERYPTALNDVFVSEIARQLAHRKPSPNKETITRWILILVQNSASVNYQPGLSFVILLERAIELDAINAATLLFAHLTEPRLKLKKPFNLLDEEQKEENVVDVEVEFPDVHLHLQELWSGKLRPRLADLAIPLWPNIIRNICQAYELLHVWGKASPQWDPLSLERSSIEHHEQDQYPSSMDVLIDAARDCLEWALHTHEPIGRAWIESLAAMDSQILQRLAIYGISITNSLTPAEKVRWLLEKGFLMATGLKHEVFQLLKQAYPKVGAELRLALLDAAITEIDSVPEEDKRDKDGKEYKKFNLFIWLSSADPSCEEVRTRLDEIKLKFPDFRPREHPDLAFWLSGASWSGPRSPLSVNELLEIHPQEWMEDFVTYVGDDFRGPDRNGLLKMIGEAVALDLSWGKELVGCLIEKNDPTLDLWECVFSGLRSTELSEEEWDFILSISQEVRGLARHRADDISDLLEHGAQKKSGGIPVSLLGKADEVAEKVWSTLEDKEDEGGNDWVMKAINHPAGKLPLFWCHALTKSQEKDGGKKLELIQPYKDRFNTIIDAKTEAGALGRVILASQLGFLSFLDEVWSRENIVPLFDWNKGAKQARQAWEGWLTWGRPLAPVLDELLPHYRNAFSHLSSELERKREPFVQHVVVISLFGINNPLEDNWLFDFLEKAEEQDRTIFASHLGNRLFNMKDDTKTGLWQRWLKRYWEARNQGVPLSLSEGELNRMVEWAGELEPVFPEVVDVICEGRVPTLEHTSVFHRMKKGQSGLSVRYPEAMCRYLIHLISYTDVPRYFCRDLEELTDQVVSSEAPADLLKQLCERLAKVGCLNAGELSKKIKG